MCGEVRPEHVGKRLTLSGWADGRRDHGGLVFVDLRDRAGICQLVVNPELAPDAVAAGHAVRNEFVLRAEGTVVRRAPANVNPDLPTGEVELQVDELEIVSRAPALPFQLDEENVDETLRLRYRWLDLRRPRMQRNIALRAQMVSIIRREMEADGFLDIQTPILFKPTPEGARDFIVPSRLQPGRFFALPQSPQILKQLLVIGGFDRYYQIAICFRDEDLRADRVQEITQLDVEMAFPDQEFLFALMERMCAAVWREGIGDELVTPFERMTHGEAQARFGSDKPDLRFGLEIEDATEATRGSEFGVFGNAPAVRFIRVPQALLAGRARAPRGAREGVGGEGARVPRLRRGRRRALADREVPLGGRARALPRRAGLHCPLRRSRARDRRTRAGRAAPASRPGAGPDRRERVALRLDHRLPDVRVGRGRRALDGRAPPVHAAGARLGGARLERPGRRRPRSPTTSSSTASRSAAARSGSTSRSYRRVSSTRSSSPPRSSGGSSASCSTRSRWARLRTAASRSGSSACSWPSAARRICAT